MTFELETRHGWAWGTAKAALLLGTWALVACALLAMFMYGELIARTSPPDAIRLTRAAAPSRVFSPRGFVIGGLERGGDDWIPYSDLSPDFVRATIASEDERFFSHGGVNPAAIVRAAIVNVSAGANVQGGSTLTQQLAKSFVGSERTFERKLEEMAVARHIEANFSKPEIFEAWANRAYFGAGAYGVGAAARVYFGVEPGALDLAQSALLVSIVPAPSRANPYNDPDGARVRRNRVLERLRETGLATRTSVTAALSRDLGLVSTAERRVHAPEVERAVWRALDSVDPDTDWRRGGRVVESTVDLVRQQHVRQAVAAHLHALDERQGWRGALGTVDDLEAFQSAWRESYSARSSDETMHSLVPAVVTAVSADRVEVWAGETRALGSWRWAVPYREDADNHGESLDDARDALSVGDVVLVDVDGHLRQFPRVEGAFASLDLATGDIQSLVGQYDADRSAFDRVMQGCRQPGSTFKPVVYSAALDAGYTAATLLRDGPLRMELGPNEEWRPRNADGDFSGHVTLWHAFVTSRNLAALEVAEDVGAARVVRRARDLGLTTPLDAVESLALGASCVHPIELLEVYATLARGGFGTAPQVVRAVDGHPPRARFRTDEGAISARHARTLRLAPAQRTAALWAARHDIAATAVTQANGYIMAWLLSEVARAGTAAGTDLPFPFAGKTGTTNAYDAWFAGFTSEEASVLWIGSDVNTRPLGRRENGSRLALPAWADAQLAPTGDTPLLPLPPTDITWVPVDLETGEQAPPDRPSLEMPFMAGSEPQRMALTQERRNRISLERLERDF